MIGAIILGLLAGFIGKALMPGKVSGGFFVTILLGLAGSVVGFLIFTELLGIGDDQIFDLGGLIGAIIGVMILLGIYRAVVARRGRARGSPRLEAQRAPLGANWAVISSSSPGSSTMRTSSPTSITVSAFGTNPPPPRGSTEMTRLTRRAASSSATRRPAAGAPCGDLDLDDLELLVGQVEQVDEPVAGHLVLDEVEDEVGRRRPPAGCRAA